MVQKKLKVFDAFTNALKNLDTQDSALYSFGRNRLALTHALALHLKSEFDNQESPVFSDMCLSVLKSQKTLIPDILVHNRQSSKKILAVMCRNDYLTEEEQKDLIAFSDSVQCELVMAVSFFPQKNYMLVYRVSKQGIEYYHFDRNTMTASAVRKVLKQTSDDSRQLKLKLK